MYLHLLHAAEFHKKNKAQFISSLYNNDGMNRIEHYYSEYIVSIENL